MIGYISIIKRFIIDYLQRKTEFKVIQKYKENLQVIPARPGCCD